MDGHSLKGKKSEMVMKLGKFSLENSTKSVNSGYKTGEILPSLHINLNRVFESDLPQFSRTLANSSNKAIKKLSINKRNAVSNKRITSKNKL